jgi:hypothetical protein
LDIRISNGGVAPCLFGLPSREQPARFIDLRLGRLLARIGVQDFGSAPCVAKLMPPTLDISLLCHSPMWRISARRLRFCVVSALILRSRSSSGGSGDQELTDHDR